MIRGFLWYYMLDIVEGVVFFVHGWVGGWRGGGVVAWWLDDGIWICQVVSVRYGFDYVTDGYLFEKMRGLWLRGLYEMGRQ